MTTGWPFSWRFSPNAGTPTIPRAIASATLINQPKTRGSAIIAATVNPAGHDPGLERVLLLNTLATAVNLDGWALADKNKRLHPLDGIALEPGVVAALTLPGTTIQLSNKGGIITLLNSEGLKVHGVQYNKNDVSEQGRTIVF